MQGGSVASLHREGLGPCKEGVWPPYIERILGHAKMECGLLA